MKNDGQSEYQSAEFWLRDVQCDSRTGIRGKDDDLGSSTIKCLGSSVQISDHVEKEEQEDVLIGALFQLPVMRSLLNEIENFLRKRLVRKRPSS